MLKDDKKTTFKNDTETETETEIVTVVDAGNETGTLTETDIDTDIDIDIDTVSVNTMPGDDIEAADGAVSCDGPAKKPKTMRKFMEGRSDMGDVLMEILRPELDKREKAAREEGKEESLEEGKKEGREDLLVRMICKKLRKKKDIKTITEELEEEESKIRHICEIAEEFDPGYDEEKVIKKLREKKEAA